VCKSKVAHDYDDPREFLIALDAVSKQTSWWSSRCPRHHLL